ncbi:DUF5988 family protein [Actinoplanes sp. G11-F43]|uniref:DUF5988 family protein n=1 Tax=Actinoplanes sp. G11-F43 TaxID=3424130 RepID=UPI003D346870
MTTYSENDLDGTVAVQLIGGPADLPEELRSQHMRPEEYKVKIPYYGGYEHFERRGETSATESPVPLYWTRRTRIAE